MKGLEIKDLPFALRAIVASDHVMGESKQDILLKSADAIEELLTVCREIAAFVIHYADDDEVSAEVLCRKLHKIGVIEKDGAWWALPEPPKEENKR